MARVDFNNIGSSNRAESSSPNSIGFFSLKNDGDEAIVRFMHDTTESFEILGTHSIQVNGKFRRINCVRTPSQSVSECPFCNRGERMDYRFFIHLLQYTNNPDGSVNVEPKVWERSISYAHKLKEYINNYGPMSDVICKIVRHGKAGDMKTEYEIIPNLSKQVYRDDIFVKKNGCFDGYSALGGPVLDKTVEEINEFLNTGDFPYKKTNAEGASVPQEFSQTFSDDKIEWSVERNSTTTNSPNQQIWEQPTQPQARPQFQSWGNNDAQTPIQRPVRF